jgi:hypothetical protein
MARLRPRLSYSNVIATLALFLALGGGAYAVSRNEVTSRDIAPDAVRGTDVQEASLSGVGAGLLGGGLKLPDNAVYSGLYNPFGGGDFGDPANSAVAPTDFKATKLRVRLFNPVTTGERRFTLRVKDTDTALTCSIPAGDKTCKSKQTVPVPKGAFFTLRAAGTATGGAEGAFGLRAVTP